MFLASMGDNVGIFDFDMDTKTSCRAKAGQDAFCVDRIILLFHYDPLVAYHNALEIGCHFLAEEVVEG